MLSSMSAFTLSRIKELKQHITVDEHTFGMLQCHSKRNIMTNCVVPEIS